MNSLSLMKARISLQTHMLIFYFCFYLHLTLSFCDNQVHSQPSPRSEASQSKGITICFNTRSGHQATPESFQEGKQ